jgi:hypothetical protein
MIHAVKVSFLKYHVCTNCVFDIDMNNTVEHAESPTKAQKSTNEPKQRPNKHNRVVGIGANKCANEQAQTNTNRGHTKTKQA